MSMAARRIVPIVAILLMAYVIFSVVWTFTQPLRVVPPTSTRTPWPTYTPRAISMELVVATPTASPTSVATPTPSATSRPAPTATASASVTATPRLLNYVVQAGDTMLGIAIRFGVEYQTLLDANDVGDADFLYAGQELVIPVREGEAAPDGRTHTVQPGETLWGIAVQYEVDYNALLRTNAITDPDRILEGQVLIIPEA